MGEEEFAGRLIAADAAGKFLAAVARLQAANPHERGVRLQVSVVDGFGRSYEPAVVDDTNLWLIGQLATARAETPAQPPRLRLVKGGA